ncbi:DUF202 domain-containing protein [Acerihabitans sp.]|uniref:DUF202 domain-containing protein n=1 Tax=Acerihabitans sp. TaxID=2811394 RepID=UPI002ED7AFF1
MESATATNNRDPGLQPERTRLAWSRTLYVLVIESLLFIRVGWLKHLPLITGAGVMLVCLAAVMVGVKRYARSAQPSPHRAFTLQQRHWLFRFMSFILLIASAMMCFSVLNTCLESRLL